MGADRFVAHDGAPLPLGASFTSCDGTNLAVYAREPTNVTLVLYPRGAPSSKPVAELKLDASRHRTGHVWHCEVRPAPVGMAYMWRVGAQRDPRWYTNECLDPYARLVDSAVGPSAFNDRSLPEYSPRALVPLSSDALDFDWQDVAKPKIPWNKLVVYELHVRGFTKLSPAGTNDDPHAPSTYSGVVERIPYLKALGVNCVELLPIMEYNEREWSHIDPSTNQPLSQYWGYSTVAFFAPMNRFGRNDTTPEDVVREFKYMVRELHRARIEVVLDVVYNHTAEMALDYVGPGHYGMKTLAPLTYYILHDDGKRFANHTGCGNTVNANNPIVQDLIVDSLRYWAHEMRVDGFRFDLASALCRDTNGNPMERPPVIERMTKDATMREVKLIAEPWDCGGLYQVGSFPHFGAWAEWNGKFRDCIRRFIRGDHGMNSEFATRICGSDDLYNKDGRQPHHSINFVIAHDGFSLRDLVSYNEKRNINNGEHNKDGDNHNDSWNCGVEGETSDSNVLALRARQQRNLLVALMMSNGTPMLSMGDEYGLTRRGNNNGWCQDSELSWFAWEQAEGDRSARSLVRFTAGLVAFRERSTALQGDHFLSPSNITWHGEGAHHADWHSGYNLLAFVLHSTHDDIYVAFNAGGESRTMQLPSGRGAWHRVLDTNLEPPKDMSEDISAHPVGDTYHMAPWSSVVLTQMGSGRNGGSLLKTTLEGMFKRVGKEVK